LKFVLHYVILYLSDKYLRIEKIVVLLTFEQQKSDLTRSLFSLFGGGEGIWTPVRRSRHMCFYGCSHDFDVTLASAS